jgi:hypothetical protein
MIYAGEARPAQIAEALRCAERQRGALALDEGHLQQHGRSHPLVPGHLGR